jgi:hypothetical protein
MGSAEKASIPDRSYSQRMSALKDANHIRSYRARLKLDIKAGRISVFDLLSNPPEEIMTMKLFDLLLAMPHYGRTKVNKSLNYCHVSSSKTIEGMTERQREDIVRYLLRR